MSQYTDFGVKSTTIHFGNIKFNCKCCQSCGLLCDTDNLTLNTCSNCFSKEFKVNIID